ncbi:spore gernimation protein GerD [Geobacillus subterraneus]|uniref:Spore gernimation protein GerD n=2 Tax=Geobacillus TaxID=129337 RepID=A0ABN4NJE1_9BACL|nr:MULTISPECIES: spore germination lipoprotein GerD [Geobacillus]AMX84806.1 spore gernimation protein GerD [Geobacillus subterraneus]KZS25951.1 spore gernimation protein GerD [Geobacillus subterraneus]OXB85632.1 spore gernimation protein GerD [Geobacillus uzenensis]
MNKCIPLLLLSFLVLSSCAPQEISPPPPDYEQTKKMVVDILKTDEGKKAIQDIMSEDQMKQQLVMDQTAVKETLQQVLTSDQGKKFWENAFKDPKFAESFAKGLQKEHEKMMKALMKDPEYQEMMIDILKDPEVQKAMIDVLKSKEFRQHLQKVITETLNSPLYQAKIQDMLTKAAETLQQGGGKQGEEGGEGGEGEGEEGGGGNQQGGGG